MHAAKALGATAVDLFQNAKRRTAIRGGIPEQTEGFVYKPYIPDGPPPIPRD